MEQFIKNLAKQERYKQLKTKLKKAIQSEFWLEACMIEYAIIEDRTSSILCYSNVCKDPYSSNKKLSNKLNSIELQIGKQHPIISNKVNVDTLEEIKTWKEERNDLVHRSCTLYNEEKAKEIAILGKKLCDLISNDSQKVSRMAAKIREDN